MVNKAPLYRRSVLAGGLAMPVAFVAGAQAAPLARLAYEEQGSLDPADHPAAYHATSFNDAPVAFGERFDVAGAEAATARPPVPPLPPVPAHVTADAEYRQLAARYYEAASYEIAAVARYNRAQARWAVAKSDPRIRPDALTGALDELRQSQHAAAYASARVEESKIAAACRAARILEA